MLPTPATTPAAGEINDLGTYYTDENGQFQLTGLRDGWYKVTEQEPPTGYAIKEATQEVYIKSGTSKTLTFENIPLSALVVWKYDSVTGEAVSNAVFQVKYLGRHLRHWRHGHRHLQDFRQWQLHRDGAEGRHLHRRGACQ